MPKTTIQLTESEIARFEQQQRLAREVLQKQGNRVYPIGIIRQEDLELARSLPKDLPPEKFLEAFLKISATR